MLTMIAVPMVAAEDDYESCLDVTEICDETHAEIKELFTELDIAIVNYNQASKNGLPTYEYAEEINAITKDLVELGIEFELQRVIELEAVVEPICPDEFEDLYEEINELLTELDALILSHNEAYKAGNMDAVLEYGQEIDGIVQELGKLGVPIEIERNSIILSTTVFWIIVGGIVAIFGGISGVIYIFTGFCTVTHARKYTLKIYALGEHHPIVVYNVSMEDINRVKDEHNLW